MYLRRTGSYLVGIAALTVVATSYIDILSNRGFIGDIEETLPFGFVLFIFIQAILIAWRFSQAYRKVETTEEELRQSESKYRTIFEESRDLIFVLGLKAELLDISPSCEVILGYTREEAQQMRIHDFIVDRRVRDLFAEALASTHVVRDWEMMFRHKSGKIFPGRVTAGWRYGDQGKIIGMQGLLRDITNVKRQEQLAREKEIAEDANRAKSSFLATMSHELRTPLNTILGYTEMLKENAIGEGAKQTAEDLDRIHRSGIHLLTLVNDVLDLSKIEAGKMELHITSFDLSYMVLDVAVHMQAAMEKNGNTLIKDVDNNLAKVDGDETKIKQILLNLLSNAAKFTQRGTVTLKAERIEGEKTAGPDSIVFTVSDTGVGMAAEQLATLFDAFVQADEAISARYGGTGLGMALTKRFCELMGGQIAVTSEKGVGTTFVVTLPI